MKKNSRVMRRKDTRWFLYLFPFQHASGMTPVEIAQLFTVFIVADALIFLADYAETARPSNRVRSSHAP
jgi:hypothetical protein